MLKNTVRLCWVSLGLLAVSSTGSAQDSRPDCTEDAMLVFDGSGSMTGTGHNGLTKPRIEEARVAIEQAIPQITPFRKVGLIIFGPGEKDSCSNIDLRFRPLSNAAARIISDVTTLEPIGETPLTQAVRNAVEVLELGKRSGAVLLITDGRESCGGDPCSLAKKLAELSNVTVHVIGFKVRARGFQWNGQGDKNRQTEARCLAEKTGGHYASTESVEELTKALREALACPLFSYRSRLKWRS